MNKDKIKNLVEAVREFDGSLSLGYVPESVIHSTEEVYGLYYSGWAKMELGKNYFRTSTTETVKVTDDNVDEIVDTIHKLLVDNIGDFIMKALENLNLEDTDLKYFDRDLELYMKFKQEVSRLKEIKKEQPYTVRGFWPTEVPKSEKDAH